MAGFVPSPRTMKINLHWSIHGRPQLNVLHALNDIVGPAPPGNAQSLFNALAAALTSSGWVTALATTTSFTAVGVTDLRTQGVPEILSTGTAIPGTDATPALPDQVSLVLTERTAQTGRSHRGRIYTFGYSVDNVEPNGTCIPGVANNAISFFNTLRTQLSTLGWQLAIRSPALPARPSKPGGTLPAKDYEITPVTTIEARDLIWDTNRRRTDLLRR